MIDLSAHPDSMRTFGLAKCRYREKISEIQVMVGEGSPAFTFSMKIWDEMGGLDPRMALTHVSQIIYHCLMNRKWNLWMTNTPLIHFQGADTLVHADFPYLSHFHKTLEQDYERYEKKYGWDYDHITWIYFAEICAIYHDEIVNAVNELRFSDIDFIFDEFWNRVKNKKLENCELKWCYGRSTCKH